MISKFFINRPIFASVISILIVLLGALAYPTLPVEQYPEMAPPNIRIEAQYPGASAQVIADTVAAPLEQEINGVDRMIYMNSTSMDNKYQLDVYFEVGADIDISSVLVQNRVSIAEPKLPEDVRRQGVTVKKQSAAMVGVISLTSADSSRDDLFLANYININMKDEIARIYGVGSIVVFPTKDYGMRVWLDPEKLKARDLTVTDITTAIQQQNIQVAAGAIGRQPAPKGTAFEFSVNTLGRLTEPAQFEQIIVKTAADRSIVRISDVGRVELGAKDYNTIASYGGKPAAIMVLYQLPGANLVAVAENVAKTLERMKKDFPQGVEGEFFYDSSMFIKASLEEVNHTLAEAFILVFIVVLVFLQSLRTTIIPALTIPVSLVGTFLLMKLMGFSVNMLTMFGLVLAIGIVVDDAIVVVESVEHNMKQKKMSAKEATLLSMSQITGPIIGITLVLMAVFIPATVLPGITGAMYQQFAVTIAVSTGLSAVCALTLSPALCALFLKAHVEHGEHAPKGFILFRPFGWAARAFNKVFDWLTAGYSGIVSWACRAWPVTLLLFAGVIVLTGYIFTRVPTGFVPDEDIGFFNVAAQLPDAASLERTQEVALRASEQLGSIPGVRGVLAIPGFSPIDGQGTSLATLWIVLDEWGVRLKAGHDIKGIMGEARARLGKIQEAQFLVFGLPAINGLGNSSGFDMRVQDRASLGRSTQQAVVQTMIDAARGQSKIGSISTAFRAAIPQIFLDIDREKAMKLGVPLNSLFATLQTYLGSAYINDFNVFNRTFQVNVQADAQFRLQPEDILKLEVRNNNGDMVPLGTLLTFRDSMGPDRIVRYNIFPAAIVNGSPAAGVSSGQAIRIMEELAADQLPAGMGYEWTGMAYFEKQTGNAVIIAFAMALVIVYLLLAAQYESWTTPLAVVLSIPTVIAGAMGALVVRGLDNNVFTQIGLVLLVGLGAKNAILIVEFARENRAKGKTPREAAIEAARTRFRPILMTSFAFILGVVPLVIATGAGANGRQALGTAVFGGMIGNTVLGLLFTPTLYYVLQSLSEKIFGYKPVHQENAHATPDSHDAPAAA